MNFQHLSLFLIYNRHTKVNNKNISTKLIQTMEYLFDLGMTNSFMNFRIRITQ